MTRTGYPSDEEWAFAAPYLTLMKKDTPQRSRSHDFREVFNGLHCLVGTGALWRMLPNDFPPWPAVYQQAQRWVAAGVFESMAQAYQIGKLAKEVQAVTKQSVKVCYADQGYRAQAAKDAGIELIVIKLPEAKKGFALLLKRWVVERSRAWAARFRRLARDFERTPEILRGLHFVAFSILMLHNLVSKILESS